MKKKLIALIAFALLMEGMALATNQLPTDTVFTFKPSTNVGFLYYTGSTSQTYTANCKHNAGNRIFSSSNNVSTIAYKEDDTWKGSAMSALSSSAMTNPGESTYDGWSSQ
jgi:hypothetical protein